jgi:hypothetical protein
MGQEPLKNRASWQSRWGGVGNRPLLPPSPPTDPVLLAESGRPGKKPKLPGSNFCESVQRGSGDEGVSRNRRGRPGRLVVRLGSFRQFGSSGPAGRDWVRFGPVVGSRRVRESYPEGGTRAERLGSFHEVGLGGRPDVGFVSRGGFTGDEARIGRRVVDHAGPCGRIARVAAELGSFREEEHWPGGPGLASFRLDCSEHSRGHTGDRPKPMGPLRKIRRACRSRGQGGQRCSRRTWRIFWPWSQASNDSCSSVSSTSVMFSVSSGETR